MAKFSLQRDPRVYARGVAVKPPERKRVLGLDLGTNCGVAFADIIPGITQEDVVSYLEQWDLSLGPYDSGALRFLKLRTFLSLVQPDLVMLENVKYDPPLAEFRTRAGGLGAIVARVTPTAEFFGTLKAVVQLWCQEYDVPCHGVEIMEIKKFAMAEANIVRKGTPNKEDMIAACNTVFSTTFDPKTYEKTGVDNIADAAFAMLMGVTAYSEGLDVGQLTLPAFEQPGHSSAKPRKKKKTEVPK